MPGQQESFANVGADEAGAASNEKIHKGPKREAGRVGIKVFNRSFYNRPD